MSITCYNDLKKLKIGTINSDEADQKLLSIGLQKGVQVFSVATDKQNILKLTAGRIDLIAIQDIRLKKALINHEGLSFEDMQPYLCDKGPKLYLVFSVKTKKHIIDSFQGAYVKVSENGLRQSIINKWLE